MVQRTGGSSTAAQPDENASCVRITDAETAAPYYVSAGFRADGDGEESFDLRVTDLKRAWAAVGDAFPLHGATCLSAACWQEHLANLLSVLHLGDPQGCQVRPGRSTHCICRRSEASGVQHVQRRVAGGGAGGADRRAGRRAAHRQWVLQVDGHGGGRPDQGGCGAAFRPESGLYTSGACAWHLA